MKPSPDVMYAYQHQPYAATTWAATMLVRTPMSVQYGW